MLDVVVFSTDEGIELRYAVVDESGVAVDLSAASVKEFVIHKPDGTSEDVSVSFVTDGSDGLLKYVYEEAFGQVGLWKYRARYQTSAGVANTDWLEFYVKEPSPINSEWGGESANCYISLIAANAFVTSSVVDASKWTESTDTKRAAALIEATRDIDSYSYLGARYYQDQALEFPREFRGSWPWNRTTTGSAMTAEQQRMQRAVEEAVCYQALWILRNAGRNKHQELIASGVKYHMQQIGQAQEAFAYNGGMQIQRLCPEAMASLKKYRSQPTVFRG